MKTRLILGLALILLASPAFAQKVYIDHDPGYDFDSIKTFSWMPTEETSLMEQNPLMHSRIVNAIEHYLSMAGFTETAENPDIWVTYHTSTTEEMSLNTTSFGYGYPGGWAYGGYGMGMGYGGYGSMGISTGTTTVNRYEIGTLVVDAWSRETETLIWRGMASNITVSSNPQKMERKIDKALAKIVSKSQKMEAQSAKAKGK